MKVIAFVALLGCGSARKPVEATPEAACSRIDIGRSVVERAAAFTALHATPDACRAEPATRLANALGVTVDAVVRVAMTSPAIATSIPERADRPAIASPDGAQFAIVLPHRVAVYAAATGLPISSTPVATTGGHDIALLDGGELVDASFQGVFVLDPTGARRTTLREPPAGQVLDAVVPVASPDDRHIALIDRSSIAVVTRDGARTATAARDQGQAPRWAVWRGPTLVVWDGSTVELWRASASSLALIAKHEAGFEYVPESGLTTALPTVAITHDGSTIAIASRAGIAIVGVDGSTRTIAPDNMSVAMLGYDHGALRMVDASGDLWWLDGDHATELAVAAPPRPATPGKIVIVPLSHRLPLGLAWTEVADSVVAGTTGRLVVGEGHASLAATISAGPPVTSLAWLSQGGALAIKSEGQIAVASPDGVSDTKGGPFFGGNLVLPGRSGPRAWVVSADGTPRPVQTWAPGDAAPTAAPVPTTAMAAFTSDGARVAIAPGYDRDLELHDTGSGALLETIHIPELARSIAHNAWFVDRDRTLVLGDMLRTVVWSASLKVTTWTLQEALFGVSPDGAVLVTTTFGKLEAYDLPHQRRIGEIALDTIGAVAAFRPDGRQLAVGTSAGSILLVDLPAWKVTNTIAAHDLEVTALAWRPDGALLASASAGGTVALWSPDGERRATFAFGVSDVFDTTTAPSWVALFPDGTTYGPGREHVMTSLGGIPLGLGATRDTADASAWTALFATPSR